MKTYLLIIFLKTNKNYLPTIILSKIRIKKSGTRNTRQVLWRLEATITTMGSYGYDNPIPENPIEIMDIGLRESTETANTTIVRPERTGQRL